MPAVPTRKAQANQPWQMPEEKKGMVIVTVRVGYGDIALQMLF